MSPPEKVLRIKVAVAKCANITVADLDSRKRPERIAFPRQVAISIAAEVIPQPGGHRFSRLFNRYPRTVLWAISQVRNRTELYPKDRAFVERVRGVLKGVKL